MIFSFCWLLFIFKNTFLKAVLFSYEEQKYITHHLYIL